METDAKMKKPIKNKKGQVTVEYILLAVVLITLFQLTSNTFKDNGYLNEFQDTPHDKFRNLVENGNGEVNLDKSRSEHPNHHEAHYVPPGNGPE